MKLNFMEKKQLSSNLESVAKKSSMFHLFL